MAWWNPFSRTDRSTIMVDVPETKGVIGTSDALRDFLLYGADSNHAQNPGAAFNLYENSTAVSIPVDKIAEKFADLHPIIKIGDEIIRDHPLLNLMRNPSPDFDQELFLRTTAINYLVTGETFVIMLGLLSAPPKQMYPMTPIDVSHSADKGFIQQFEVNGDHFNGIYNRDNEEFVSPEGTRELIQIRNFSTKDNSMYRGRSKLVSASDTARQQILGVEHNLSLLEKGGRMSLLFHFENDLDQDEYSSLEQSIQTKFGGAKNAGTIGVTAGGKVDIQNLTQSNQDMDWSGAQDLSAKIIALKYNYPLPLLTVDAATMNNYQTALEALYDDAVGPLSKVIYGGIMRAARDRYKLPDNAEMVYDEERVPALVRRRTDQVQARSKIGVESDNEIRNMLGRESYDGGDTVYKASNLIPVGTDFVTDSSMEIDELIDDE